MRTGLLPWDFKPTENITQQIRHDKASRQEWYKTATTAHYFYSPIESANPNMRPSKDNPPRAIHAFAADFDIAIPPERIEEGIKAMPIKPAWVERSLGGNARLVWTLSFPLMVSSTDFCVFVLQKAVAWLNLGLLPALDEPAFTNPTRLLCNGCDWKATGHGPIPENKLQAFFVACAKEFNFKGSDGPTIPMDVVEAAIREKYPAFSWPSDFTPDSQGPTFWIPESVSPMSAICKAEGMITFAAHATKTFYPWSDILGVEFVKNFITDSISKSTRDVWWDGKSFWHKEKGGVYKSVSKDELMIFFRVDCRLSDKRDGSGISPVDMALRHIHRENRISGAAPFIFKPSGLINFMGRSVLNTYSHRAVKPADTDGDWPFLRSFFENFFEPAIQLDHFFAWWKHFYTSAHTLTPRQGQNIFILGPADAGKTLLNRRIIGTSVGGHIDAVNFLIKGAPFNSELFEEPLWCVDDASVGQSEAARQAFSNALKKCAANSTFHHNKKFEVPVMVEHLGRVVITSNLDAISSRVLVPMDDTSRDKISLFRCSGRSFPFPDRPELEKIIDTELPFFLRWLLAWEPPSHVARDVRFGYKPHHEPSLLKHSKQSSSTAPYREIVRDTLAEYFRDHPDKKEWRGSLLALLRLIHTNPMNQLIFRTERLEMSNRYLEGLERDGVCTSADSDDGGETRIWIFPRPSCTT